MDEVADLWVDRPDAHERIDERCANGRITPSEASALHSFVDVGFLKVSIDLPDEFADGFADDVSRLWRERPADLAVSPPGRNGGPTSFADYDGPTKPVGYRIPDMHSHSSHALDLYLNPTLFRMVEIICGEPAIAFQSLYFEYGSEQGLHRDPMFVATQPVSHLIAAWVALEDVTEEAGPLRYVPESHRLPYFEFTPGTVICGQAVPTRRTAEFQQSLRATMQEKGLTAQPFTCRKGEAFIWHSGLVHGGARILDPSLTRKSFVTHYSTASTYRSRTAALQVRDGDGWRKKRSTTDAVIDRGETRGLDNPHHRREVPKEIDLTGRTRLRWIRRRPKHREDALPTG
jgi:phytanoyl-CoA hydroxylase